MTVSPKSIVLLVHSRIPPRNCLPRGGSDVTMETEGDVHPPSLPPWHGFIHQLTPTISDQEEKRLQIKRSPALVSLDQ
ncbi:hypothetical protein ACHWQZ_G015893 [Mnemiopsis leidyi]